ncbi:MAG: MMPL family transporter, partial [Actinobacteria bacterium]|nr:MMPL family transporter [Actinomycetota bacterium]
MSALGPIGRLGRFAASHRRVVFATWAVVAIGLGAFAPRVETALSGAGWQANGSESAQVREGAERAFGGTGSYAIQVAVHATELTAADPAFRRTVARVGGVLAADAAVGRVISPSRSGQISADGHTAIVVGTAAKDPNGMVAAANGLKPEVAAVAAPGVEANLTGAAGMWSDFNEANREAMMKSE